MSSDKFANIMVDKLNDLYCVYEDYINNNDGINLTILIYSNKINFHLFYKRNTIDNCTFKFDNNESVIYEYISIMFMINLFKNVMIHNDKTIFYNEVHLPYLKVVVLEDGMLEKMRMIMDMQNDVRISDELDVVKKIRKKIPRKYYSDKVVRNVDSRIFLSKKMLG